uniref:Uncharacterized protein n=1 Tax=Zea mays TaxID=4577 RepID=A0A804LIV2_MAIZE
MAADKKPDRRATHSIALPRPGHRFLAPASPARRRPLLLRPHHQDAVQARDDVRPGLGRKQGELTDAVPVQAPPPPVCTSSTGSRRALLAGGGSARGVEKKRAGFHAR